MARVTRPQGDATVLQRVLDALDRYGCFRRATATGWLSQCPAHDDRAPSLSVRQGEDGQVLLHCFAGCETAAVLRALGLNFSDLFPRGRQKGRGR
jgi:hypothetical protein